MSIDQTKVHEHILNHSNAFSNAIDHDILTHIYYSLMLHLTAIHCTTEKKRRKKTGFASLFILFSISNKNGEMRRTYYFTMDFSIELLL